MSPNEITAIHHWINGVQHSGKSGNFGDVFNPATGEVTAKVDFASKEEIDFAVQKITDFVEFQKKNASV